MFVCSVDLDLDFLRLMVEYFVCWISLKYVQVGSTWKIVNASLSLWLIVRYMILRLIVVGVAYLIFILEMGYAIFLITVIGTVSSMDVIRV